METVLLLFLLMNFSQKGDMKESLDKFLKFYRENRELIAMFAGGLNLSQGAAAFAASNADAPQPKQNEAQEKSRPLPEDGIPNNVNILEEFLKRSSL